MRQILKRILFMLDLLAIEPPGWPLSNTEARIPVSPVTSLHDSSLRLLILRRLNQSRCPFSKCSSSFWVVYRYSDLIPPQLEGSVAEGPPT
jgi:hypothetical protein